MKRGNKKAQFYLVAAMVIISLIIGFATIQNYTKKKAIKIYDIKDELGIEGGKVMDYGVFNLGNDEEIKKLVENFSNSFFNYAGTENRTFYLIFGTKDRVYNISNEDLVVGEINLGSSGIDVVSQKIKATPLTSSNGKVTVNVNNIEYPFELKEGENFYFIISQETGGEQHIVVS